MSTIWTEKYRPQTFDEVKGQSRIVDRVQAFVEQKNMPHLMFAGPAGVGKTTLALVIAKKMFGDDWQYNFLELNASDERGIDVVRNKIKDFARTKSIRDVPFKIIYLDECDSLTKEAQQALRRTMENYTHTCRFILSCNYSSKILDPIQSRCTVFRFKPLEEKAIVELIKKIAKTENLKVSESAIKILIDVTGGDARRLENILQSCSVISKDIDDALIFDIVSAAKPKEVLDILKFSCRGEFIKARDLMLDTMLKHGLSGFDIIKQIQKEIWNLEVEDKVKLKMSEKCGETEFRMVEGSDEFLQLESMVASFTLIGK